MPSTRFDRFTDDEILTLWEGIAYDDGILYDPAYSSNRDTRKLGSELREEWCSRKGAGADIETEAAKCKHDPEMVL